jgi:hypothetical protein
MRAAARGARVAGEIDFDRGTFARERFAPVAAQDGGESLEIVLLDQEVRLATSTFTAARRTTDERGNVFSEAAIAERFHFGDRSRHRWNEGKVAQHLFGVVELHTAWLPKNGMSPGRR